MPSTTKEHFHYTLNEWSRQPFIAITNALPKQVKVIYDIGANAGGFTELMHRQYPEAEIYSFEPVEINYEALVENTPYAKHVKLGIYYGEKESKVLWRGENIGAFFVEHINSGEPRIHKDGEMIELEELENLPLPKPDLIKLDVEGAEMNIIEHSRVVKECPNLIVEWHPRVDPLEFFDKHLPDHRVAVNLSNQQFLLTK